MDTSKLRRKKIISELLQEYNQVELEFREKYASASSDVQEELTGLLESSKNFLSADNLKDPDKIMTGILMYKNAIKKLNNINIDPISPIAASKDLFGRYSPDENIDNANYLTHKYYNQSVNSGTSSNPELDNVLSHEFNITDGLDKVYGLPTDTFAQRYGRFIDHLSKKVSDAISAKSSGKTVRGIDPKDVERLETILSELTDLKTSVVDGKEVNGVKVKLSLNEALSLLLNYAGPLNIDEETFTTYFKNFLPEGSETTDKKTYWGNKGYTFKEGQSTGNAELDTKGYHVGSLGDIDYLFDKDYELITTPDIWMDDDKYSPTKGQGYVIGSDGRFWIGDFTNIPSDNSYYELVQDYLTGLKDLEKGNPSRYHIYRDWNDLIFDSDDDFVKNLQSQYAQDLNGHNVVDVGSYFDGKAPVFAVYSDDPNKFIDEWGHLDLEAPGTTFYYFDPKTNSIIKGSYENVVSALGKLNRKSKKNDPIKIKSYRDDLDAISRESYYPQEGTNFDGSDWMTWRKNRITDYNGTKIGVTEEIKDHPVEWVKLILEIIGDPIQSNLSLDKQLMKERFYDNNPRQLLGTIWSIMTDPKFKRQIQLNETQRRGWNILLERVAIENYQAQELSQVQAQKEGGIIKAAEGVTTGLFGQTNSRSTALKVRSDIDTQIKREDELRERAAKRGVGTSTQKAAELIGLTKYDLWRMGMVAGDIASLIAALSGAPTGGFGSIAADVLGVGTAIGDTVIDALDPSVSKGETIRNAALNTAFGLAGFAGGALGKLSKKLPTIIHLTAKAVAVGGGLNTITDPEIRSSIGKVINSGKAGSEPMTTKDWQNLMIFFRSTLGATKAVSTSVAGMRMTRGHKAKALENSGQNLALIDPSQKVIRIGNKTYNINTSQQAEINKALKKGEHEKVTQLLKNLGISDEDISKVKIKDGKLWMKPELEVETPGKKSAVLSLKSKVSTRLGGGEDLSDLQIIELLKQADKNTLNKLDNSWWLRRMRNWDRVALALTPWRGSKPYSAELISLMREVNKGIPRSENIVEGRKNKEFGTREFREKLQARIDKENSLKASLQNAPAPGTVESVKYKKERVEEIVKDIDRFSKNRPRRSQKTTSELYAKAKEYESEIRNLLADLDIQGEDRDLLYDTLNKLIDFRKAMKLRSPQLWSQHGFKQGGKIDSKYSHLRK